MGSRRLFNQAAKGGSRRRAPKAPRLPSGRGILIGCAGRAAPNGSVSHTLALLPTGGPGPEITRQGCVPPDRQHPSPIRRQACDDDDASPLSFQAWPWGILLPIDQSSESPGQHDAFRTSCLATWQLCCVLPTQVCCRWWRSCAPRTALHALPLAMGFL